MELFCAVYKWFYDTWFLLPGQALTLQKLLVKMGVLWTHPFIYLQKVNAMYMCACKRAGLFCSILSEKAVFEKWEFL